MLPTNITGLYYQGHLQLKHEVGCTEIENFILSCAGAGEKESFYVFVNVFFVQQTCFKHCIYNWGTTVKEITN
jgi:hypothetical protein